MQIEIPKIASLEIASKNVLNEAIPLIQEPIANNKQQLEFKSEKVSPYSLSSIRAKKELQNASQSLVKEEVQLAEEPFTETDLFLFWNKYAQRLSDKGLRIMESLLLNNTPVLDGTNITLELSTEGSKIDFETELNGLLSFLRGHLHNHLIAIKIVVNEKLVSRKAYSPQEKYEKLREINPNLELLRKVFDLNL